MVFDTPKYKELLKEVKGHQATLIAVTKTKPVEQVQQAYEAGQRIFGENKVQEMVEKQPVLPEDSQWHCIGHLQRNKVKFIAPFVKLIHSVDSIRLLQEINKRAKENDRIIDCLLQVHIAEESSKFGFDEKEIEKLLSDSFFEPSNDFEHVRITGLMGMATFTYDEQQVRSEFRALKQLFDRLKEKYFSQEATFKEISMGMSGDYRIALEEGSTMIRVGSLLFGARG